MREGICTWCREGGKATRKYMKGNHGTGRTNAKGPELSTIGYGNGLSRKAQKKRREHEKGPFAWAKNKKSGGARARDN